MLTHFSFKLLIIIGKKIISKKLGNHHFFIMRYF